jgi:hypothetical protein
MAVLLFHEYLLILPIPAAGPIPIGPAKAEREIGLSGFQDLVEWPLKKALSIEPIMVIAKTVDPIVPRHVRLSLTRLGKSQIIKA